MLQSAVAGAELRARRQALGISLDVLSRRLDIPKNTVARWERGELEIRHAALLARALNDLEREMQTYSVVEGPGSVYRLHEGNPDGPVIAEMRAGPGNLSRHDAVDQLVSVATARGARFIRHQYDTFDWTDDLAERAG